MNKALSELRNLMKERGIDAYIVPACDFHQSEFFSAHFECTRYLSHFSGESCTLVITQDEAQLWTDGRFFVQAEEQMDPAFTLKKMMVPGDPTVTEYLKEKLPEGGTLGFDGRLISAKTEKEFKEELAEKHINYHYNEDLVGLIWTDRPALDPQPAWVFSEEYAGLSASDKLAEVRKAMKKKKADVHIMASLDDIAWLFNIRGNDIPCNPVFFAYAVITADSATVFMYEEALNDEVRAAFAACGTTVQPYDSITSAAAAIPAGSKVLLDEKLISTSVIESLPKDCKIINAMDPVVTIKAVKNPVEIKNIRDCHIRDGIAMVRFMMWLEANVGKIDITEMSAADVLDNLRREQPGNMGLSFDTISAYGPHGAMMHYKADPSTNAAVEPHGFLLVDSGGQYMAGTTDITRTFVLGDITPEMKLHFTAVVRGMLNLSAAKFLSGCSGLSLDYLARQPMWDLGIDYRCGTGHGVGYLLNVHEGPHGFYFKPRHRYEQAILEPGMVITDEPGIYLDYKYGIRTENELLIVPDEANEYGQFLKFEHLTYCPIDLKGIEPSLMTDREKKLLNDYHHMVYEKLSGHLTPEEVTWLKNATREI